MKKNQQELSEEYIEETRALALESLFFFTKAICGFDRLTERFHKEMCDRLQSGGALRRLWLLPRDHYKSTIVCIAYPLWLLCKNHEERILIAADTAGGAEKKLRKIRSLIESSPQIRAFFPEIRPESFHKGTWSDAALAIPRSEAHAEPSLSTVGAGGAVIGQHFTHIILDDLVTKEAAESPTTMQRVVEWVDNVESLLERPYDNTIDVVGTRWTHDDIYKHIENHWPAGGKTLDRVFFESYQKGFWDGTEETETVLFPELYGGVAEAKDFAYRMARQNPYLWSCNYLNAPQVPEAEFDLDTINYYEVSTDEDHILYSQFGDSKPRVTSISSLALYLHCDPAYSKRQGASQAAIVVSGVDGSGRIFILEGEKGRWGGQGLMEKMFSYARRYGGKLRAIGIEATGTQITYVEDVQKEARRKQIWVPVQALLPGSTKSKVERIRFHLQPYVAQRRLYLKPELKDLIEEFKNFPLSEDRDLLDALAYGAIAYWGRQVGPADMDKKYDDEYAQKRKTANQRTGY